MGAMVLYFASNPACMYKHTVYAFEYVHTGLGPKIHVTVYTQHDTKRIAKLYAVGMALACVSGSYKVAPSSDPFEWR